MTLNILEEFLLNFKGCLLLVSHDRYFMDRLVDHMFVFEGSGKIKDFPGNYSDYRYLKTDIEKESIKNQAPVKEIKSENKTENKPSEKRKLSFNEKKEYEQLEKEIDVLETKKEQLILKMNTGISDHQELQTLAKNIEDITSEIEDKSNRWLELGEFME